MKMKAVLKSLLIAYSITGVFLLFLALALFSFDLSEKAVRAGILAAYNISLPDWWIWGWKNAEKRKISVGTVGRKLLFLFAFDGLCPGRWETRYDNETYDHYVFSVPGRRNSWRDVVLTL